MNSGRHFTPPSPAYRPTDPFSSFVPLAAEQVPSCESTVPPPHKPRPVRMDPSAEQNLSEKVTGTRTENMPRNRSLPSRPIDLSASKPAFSGVPKAPTSFAPAAVTKSNHSSLREDEEMRSCEWMRCGKTFVAKKRGGLVVRRFCSATCRGRASEARNGKR